MERDELINLLENKSETELILIQNYLLDQILKKMPTETEAIRRCVETSKKIKDLEDEVMRLKNLVDCLQTDLAFERNSKRYNNATDVNGYSSWADSAVTSVTYNPFNAPYVTAHISTTT
jgi:hypothetical protein